MEEGGDSETGGRQEGRRTIRRNGAETWKMEKGGDSAGGTREETGLSDEGRESRRECHQ
jgi:hypothetical protein